MVSHARDLLYGAIALQLDCVSARTLEIAAADWAAGDRPLGAILLSSGATTNRGA